jgi:hypothetical protein
MKKINLNAFQRSIISEGGPSPSSSEELFEAISDLETAADQVEGATITPFDRKIADKAIKRLEKIRKIINAAISELDQN